MLLLAIFDIPQRLLIEVILQEQLLYLFELIFKVIELFIVVFLDRGHLFSYTRQLPYLVLDLVLEEAHLVLEVFHAQLLEHHYVVATVLAKQALETDRAQVRLAKGLYLFRGVNLTPALLKLTNLIVIHCIFKLYVSLFLEICVSLFYKCNSNYILLYYFIN